MSPFSLSPIERRHDRGCEFQRRLPDAARDRLCLLLGDHFGEPLSSTSQERGCGPDCISLDGESNWLEGIQLLALYFMAALAFFVIPGGA